MKRKLFGTLAAAATMAALAAPAGAAAGTGAANPLCGSRDAVDCAFFYAFGDWCGTCIGGLIIPIYRDAADRAEQACEMVFPACASLG